MHSPALNPLPWSVWLLTLTIAGVELVLWAGAHGLVNSAGSAGWRAQALALTGVNPGVQGWMIETGQTPLPHLARYVGFGLVHQGPLQAALVIVITAALGKVCAERIGSLRLLLVLALSQAAGGFTFGLVAAPEAWLIGGYPLIFALAGCYAGQVWHEGSDTNSRRKALALVAVLILGRLALAAMVGGGMDWIADLVACLAGYALGRALRPGLRARLRRA
ncbi:MAG: rhomboid family intramembrane serine protease [Rhodobacteraceae bacterium]|nr:rhomboid family intramembrane serine protease [Paracoccaceae bacterium]MCC5965848.1 rhomboid family intramembrane serine protease [Natronohydrobacter sp.]